jgi:hypothetical protein
MERFMYNIFAVPVIKYVIQPAIFKNLTQLAVSITNRHRLEANGLSAAVKVKVKFVL